MQARTSTILTALVLALAIPLAATAGANRIPQWSLATEKDVKKAIKTFGFTTDGKAATWPKKIAIPAFVIRYDKEQYDKDTDSRAKFRFTDDASYVAVTDALYDAVVKRFTEAGFEVVPRDTVIHAASYAALQGEPGDDVGGERVRGIPSGMKDLGTKFGKPRNPDDLAALNRELGTDAVVAIYANFGLCIVDANMRNPFSGTKPCMKGNLTLPGLSMMFVGGAKGEGKKVKPVWTSRAFKAVEAFTYQDGSGKNQDSAGHWVDEVPDKSDAALISPIDLMAWSPDRLFTGVTGGDGQALAQGIDDMLDLGFTLAMETFYDKNAKAMDAASFPRPALMQAHPTAVVLTKEQRADKMAEMVAKVEEMKASVAARPEGAPVAAGTVSCYQSPAAGAQSEALMRRGMEPGRLVEESVVIVPALGPVQAVNVYKVGAGTYEISDSKATWTGTGTFEGPADAWTAWNGNITAPSGSTVVTTGAAEGTGLHVVTVIKGPDGAVAQTIDYHYALLDPAACDTAWAAALASKVPPIPVPGAKKANK